MAEVARRKEIESSHHKALHKAPLSEEKFPVISTDLWWKNKTQWEDIDLF